MKLLKPKRLARRHRRRSMVLRVLKLWPAVSNIRGRFLPDGRMLVTERPGRLRFVEPRVSYLSRSQAWPAGKAASSTWNSTRASWTIAWSSLVC